MPTLCDNAREPAPKVSVVYSSSGIIGPRGVKSSLDVSTRVRAAPLRFSTLGVSYWGADRSTALLEGDEPAWALG